MKLPVCEEDLNSGKLCQECKDKLEKGQINQLDVELSKILHKLSRKETIINCPDLVKTEELEGDQAIAIVEGDPAALIGRGGRIIRLISDQLGKKLRVVKKGTVNQVTDDLINPVKSYGVNTLYRTDGEVRKRVTVPFEEKRRINMKPEKAEKALKVIKGEQYELKFV